MKTSSFTNPLYFRSLVFSGLLIVSEIVIAQTPLWADVNNIPAGNGTQLISPEKFRKVRLNLSVLKGILSRTVLENTAAANASSLTLDLPMPYGGFEKFVIVESPIMEPELAKKFPEIKTYAGYSMQNKANTVRFDFTPAGFHAMIFSSNGTFFIDPFSNATNEFYISYNKADYISKEPFECGVGSELLPGTDSTQKKQNPDNINDNNRIKQVSASPYGDGVLRTYRLALAATVEYTTFHGGTVSLALAAQVTAMNRVNGIYLREFAVKMILVANNSSIIYTAEPDPYSNSNGSAMLGQNQTNLNTVIGSANYDIGHVFSTGGGGIATLNSPCNASTKARGVTGLPSPVGDPFYVDYVAHEMGHQFGGNHTFNNSCSSNRNSSTAFEPGSGSTIMAYAGICAPNVQSNSDAFFHGGNFPEMYNFITTVGTCAATPGNTNALPVISTYTNTQTIPGGTPFFLSATATDTDGNGSLTYTWDQMNKEISTQAPLSTSTGGPNFKSFNPSSSGTRYFPQLTDLINNTVTTWEVLPTVTRTLKFRLIVRDNAVTGGGNDHADIDIGVDGNSGPFVVTLPTETGITWAAGSAKAVNWNVANSNLAPVSCTNVDILLSIDGGLTYPHTLATNAPNTGIANVTMPVVNTISARIMVRGNGRAFFDISNNNFTINCASSPSIPTSVAVNSTAICSGSSVTLTATCAIGTITWFNQSTGGTALGTGNNFSHSPTTNTTYFAGCNVSGCSSSSRVSTEMVLVDTPVTNLNLTTNYTTGATLKIATQLLTATNKIVSPAGAVYRAGKSVTLNPGFEAQNGSMFKTEVKGCN